MFDASAAVREREATGIGRGPVEVFGQTMHAVNRGDLATKADIAELKVELVAAVNRMLLSQIAVAGVLLAAMALLKFV